MTFERLTNSEDGKERYQITLPKKSTNAMIPDNPLCLKGIMLESKQLIVSYMNNEVEQWIVTVTPKGQEDETTGDTIN